MVLIAFTSLYIISVFIFSHFASSIILPKLIAIFAAIFYVFDAVKSQKPIIEISSCHIIFLIWASLAFVAGIIAGPTVSNYYTALTILQVFLISLVLYGTVIHRSSIEWLAWAVVIGLLISSIGGDLKLLPKNALETLGPMDTGRFSGTMENSNIFGYSCVVAISFIFYIFRVHRQFFLRLCLIIIAAYLTLKITETGSRKAILGFMGLIGIEYLFYVFKRSLDMAAILKILGMAILVLSLVGSFWFLLETKGQSAARMRNLSHFFQGEQLEGGEGSIYERLYFIHHGWDLLLRNPVIGTGLSSFSESRIGKGQFQTKSIGTYSHCNYIEVIVSSGILGFLIYYSMYAIIIKKVRRIIKLNRKLFFNEPTMHFVMFIIPYSLFVDFFYVPFDQKDFWIFFTALLGGITIMENILTKQEID
jgi:O-antigen ligase